MQSREIEGAIVPSGEKLLDGNLPEQGDYIFDGRFYQTVDQDEYARRQNSIDRFMNLKLTSIMPIGTYQRWVELDWKEPHGTHRAAERWAAKLKEEAGSETPDALYEYAASNGNDPELKEEAVDELGDTLWTVCAVASNGGQSAEDALQSYLWGDGRLSHRENHLKIDKIDAIIKHGFTPWYSPIDVFDPPGDDISMIKLDEMEPMKNLTMRGLSLALHGLQQFGDTTDGFLMSWYNEVGKNRIAPQVADQIMLVAWYARHFADATLGEVVETNIRKLRPRVEIGLIDKTDGDRSQLA